jgi:hypothetical protein
MLGPFINFRPLRLRVPGEESFASLLAGVREAVLETSTHSQIAWQRLAGELRARGVRPAPVVASFAAWESVTGMEFGGLRLEALPRGCGAARGFRVGVNRHYEADRCWVDFDPHRFDPVAVAAFAGRLRAFLAAVATEPSRPVRELHESLASSKPAAAQG